MKILKNITHLVVIGIIATLLSSGALAIAPDYGDLVYLLRDDNGVPIPSEDGCRQPLAFPTNDNCPMVAEVDCPDPTTCVVPLVNDEETICGITPGFESCVREVEFGRMSVSRSPEDIFTRQLCDVVTTLDAADQIQLDPAGRLVAFSSIEGVEPKTIDSPVQNLAIYWLLMLNNGNLQINTDLLPGADGIDACADVLNKSIPLPASAVITAARGLGAASDKGGKVDVDLIAYLNRILGLTDEGVTGTLFPNDSIDLCKFYTEEDKGVAVQNEECFLDYRSFDYLRETNFGEELPDPPYVPLENPEVGWFEYLWLYPDATTLEGDPLFFIKQGPILNAVFPLLNELGEAIDIDPGETGGNIAGFAQAADDARAVINFMHEHPVPVGYETEVIYEGDDGNGGSGTSTSSSSSDGGCSVAGGNPATDLSLLAIVLAALGYLGLGMTRRT